MEYFPMIKYSVDLSSVEHAFQFLKTNLEAERPTDKQQQKAAAIKSSTAS